MKNFILDNNFTVTYPLLPLVAETTTSFSIPSMSLGVSIHPNPKIDIQIPGSKLAFDPLIITFKISEDLSNYSEVFNWFLSMRDPESSNLKDRMSDLSLNILSNNKKALTSVVFYDAFPTLLSEVQFSTNGNADSIETTISFSYSYFKII